MYTSWNQLTLQKTIEHPDRRNLPRVSTRLSKYSRNGREQHRRADVHHWALYLLLHSERSHVTPRACQNEQHSSTWIIFDSKLTRRTFKHEPRLGGRDTRNYNGACQTSKFIDTQAARFAFISACRPSLCARIDFKEKLDHGGNNARLSSSSNRIPHPRQETIYVSHGTRNDMLPVDLTIFFNNAPARRLLFTYVSRLENNTIVYHVTPTPNNMESKRTLSTMYLVSVIRSSTLPLLQLQSGRSLTVRRRRWDNFYPYSVFVSKWIIGCNEL